jgi:hypothetical protein
MKAAIYFSFVFLGAYALSIFVGHTQAALFLMGLSPLVVLYTVYKVLRDPNEVKVTFEDHFYQDEKFPRSKD